MDIVRAEEIKIYRNLQKNKGKYRVFIENNTAIYRKM
jgi:hypothetical protein